MSESISNGGVCRTAPDTPGLLNNVECGAHMYIEHAIWMIRLAGPAPAVDSGRTVLRTWPR